MLCTCCHLNYELVELLKELNKDLTAFENFEEQVGSAQHRRNSTHTQRIFLNV